MKNSEDMEWGVPRTRLSGRKRRKYCGDEENEPLYKGEEEFMNAIHPLEIYAPKGRKKSSPMQRAIITCINNHHGSASEEQILEYILSKWDIINKYSERGVLTEPTIRVVRLNCAVKKRSRHLFIKSTTLPNTWMLNCQQRKNHRKTPIRKIPEYMMPKELKKNSSETEEEEEAPNDEEIMKINANKDEKQSDDMEEDNDFEEEEENEEPSFEDILLELLNKQEEPLEIKEIEKFMEEYKEKKGMFMKLPLQRRVKACLINMKVAGKVEANSAATKWIATNKYYPMNALNF